MVLLVFISTTSFTVDMHYCMGRLMDVGILEEAESCADAGLQMDDHSETIDRMPCCEDKQIISAASQDLQPALEKFSLEQLQFVAAFTHSFLLRYRIASTKDLDPDSYAPPNLVVDIQQRNEVYLI